MGKTSEIKLKIELDENHIPEKLNWNAPDSGTAEDKECKAFMLTIWDEKENNTLRIDLWNKEMQVEEMRKFCFQSMITMADTLERATSDTVLAQELRNLSQQFALKVEEAGQKDEQQ